MLEKQEYYVLNDIIKNIYKIKNSSAMRKKVLSDLKALIDFRFSAFSLGALKNKSINLVDSIIVSDFEKSFEEQFIYLSESQYDTADYATWIFRIPESVVYKDSEIVDDRLRKKTSYYKDYLLANDLPHVAGISIVYEGKFLGALTLYKSKRTGDFTEKDMFILEFLQPHLESRLGEDDENTVTNRKNVSYLLKSNYGMTTREIEILGLLLKGKSNEEISAMLVISNNTVKKHLSHIYEKLGVTNRSQTVQFILDNDLPHLWT